MARNTLQHFCSIYPSTSTLAPSLAESHPRILIFQYRKLMCRKETGLLNIKSSPCGLKRFPRNLASHIMSSDNRAQRSLNDLELVIRISAFRGLGQSALGIEPQRILLHQFPTESHGHLSP